HQRNGRVVLGIANFFFREWVRKSAETGSSLVLRFHHCETFPLNVRLEDHECNAAARAMSFNSFGYVDVGDDLSVNDQKRFVVEKMTGIIQRARGTKDLRRLNRVFNVDAIFRAVSQRAFDRIRLMMKIDDNVPKTESRQVFGNVSDQRFSQKWDRWLGPVYR